VRGVLASDANGWINARAREKHRGRTGLEKLRQHFYEYVESRFTPVPRSGFGPLRRSRSAAYAWKKASPEVEKGL